MKRLLAVATGVAVAAGILVSASMPPARLTLSGAADDGTIPGVLHVHTNRSDGRSSPAEVAAAAARAGLKFVVFTDHGDGTRVPDPPAYRTGVLCIDGVEISTTAGHYVALGLSAAPYPLGGEPRDVVEDVRRLGGFGIAAHPDSPKTELRWGDWDAPIDGMELINPDTSWRARVGEPGIRPKLHLLSALVTYPFVPEETIASLLGDPSGIIERWQSLTGERPVVGTVGVDVHAKLALRDVEPGDNRFTLPFPGYETTFRTLSVHVRPDRPLSGDASADADAVLQAIRAGGLYTAIDAIATPPSFEFSASSKEMTVQQGSALRTDEPVRLRIRSNAPREFTTTVWEGGRVLTEGRREEDFTFLVPPGQAVYRVEVRASTRLGKPLWIISNPIYVSGRMAGNAKDMAGRSMVPASPAGQTFRSGEVGVSDETLMFPVNAFGWSVEHDPGSRADVDLQGNEMRFRFSLAVDPTARPGVAIAAPPHSLLSHDRAVLTMRAEHPMRVSVQLRTGVDGTREERWQRSVYVDPVERELVVAFDDMKPIGVTRTEHPPLADRPSLILVIDTTNSKAGSSGQLWIKRLTLR